jgi:hypothetical protein
VTPEELLAGPRGRRLCWEVLRRPFTELAADPPSSPASLPDLGGDALIDAVSDVTARAMYWQPPDAEDVALARENWQAWLRPVAEAVTAAPASEWWDAPIAIDDQHVIIWDVVWDQDGADPLRAPALDGVAARIAALSTEHSTPLDRRSAGQWQECSGKWWSAPITWPGLLTTRWLGDDRGPARLWWVEDGMGWSGATSWPVWPAGTPRVLELTEPDDWAALVRAYPLDVSATSKRGDWWRTTGRDGRWAMPDWPAVAADYDAVHLTVAAYLAGAGRALAVKDAGEGDVATVLAGREPDATFWLADVLQIAGAPTRWVGDNGSDWRPAAH